MPSPSSPLDEMNAESLSTAPREDGGTDASVTLPRLGTVGMLRWAWRQLTSMRVALILLFLLSLAAIPGSLLPQQSANTDPALVTDYLARHKTIGPILDHLQFFEVYKSAWFSAIYLLLFISLIGCIVPRSWAHAKVLRKPPPSAPRNLARMPVHTAWDEESADAEARLAAAEKALKAKRFRVVRGADAHGGWVSAEKGYLREVGNLVFHLSLVGILVGFAIKGYYGYQGAVQVIEGQGFTAVAQNYDEKTLGGGVDPQSLPAFHLGLDKFTASYNRELNSSDYGQPLSFAADVTYNAAGSPARKQKTITLNHPLTVDGANVYLTSHGYAPVIKVQDASGKVLYDSPVLFTEAGAGFKSFGTLRIPAGIKTASGSATELGIQGWFLPDFYGMDPNQGPVSAFPGADNPALVISAYTGDLGDTGSVYQIDLTHAQQLDLNPADANNVGAQLYPGQSVALPGGIGTVTFEGYKQFAQFNINHDPSKPLVFASAIGIVGGLLLSLGIRRRRVFVRVKPAGGPDGGEDDGGLRVEVAGLARAEDDRLKDEVRGFGKALRPAQTTQKKQAEAGAAS
jgi:cytochrome c biogenesis protein